MAEEAPSGGERTEEPTGKRRREFRNKGQVAQSKEIHTAVLLTSVLIFWMFYMPSFVKGVAEFLATSWGNAGQYELNLSSTVQLANHLVKQIFTLLWPLFIFVIIIGVFSTLFQIGWLFTTKPFGLNFSKFNPIQGAKKILSKKSIADLIKSLMKVILVGYVVYSTLFDRFDEALLLADMPVSVTLSFLGDSAIVILAKACSALILIAFIDFLYVRWEMNEKMKMTKQEVKEEHKESEGDPRIKSQIRSIQREMARRRMMAEVPQADVIITNPTHISIAVKYVSDEMDSPLIIAKGTDHIALKIREIAKEHDVPIVENPPVARLLHKIELGANIPEEMFKAVAEILAYVYKLKNNQNSWK